MTQSIPTGAPMVETHDLSAVAALLKRDDTLVWVDVPECSDEAVRLLTDVLHCHPLAVRDCTQRNRVPRVRIYPSQLPDMSITWNWIR